MDAVLCQEKVGPWRLNPGGRPQATRWSTVRCARRHADANGALRVRVVSATADPGSQRRRHAHSFMLARGTAILQTGKCLRHAEWPHGCGAGIGAAHLKKVSEDDGKCAEGAP